MSTAVIITSLNEIDGVRKLLPTIKKEWAEEWLVVDGNSNDGTIDVLKNLENVENIKILFHKKNYGKGKAIRTALKEISGEIIIIQDADLEYDPKDYEKLIKPIVEGFSKVVYGSRVLGRKGQIIQQSFAAKFRISANYILTKFSNYINNQINIIIY